MKKFRLLIILLALGLCGYAVNKEINPPKDSIAGSKFKLSYDKGVITLVIEYTVGYSGIPEAKKDSLQKGGSIFTRFFGDAAGTDKTLHTEESIKNLIFKIVSSNPDLVLEARYPEYMNEIFDLIRSKKKKKKAKQIYLRNHTEQFISTHKSTHLLIENGKRSNTAEFSYTCTFRQKKPTQVVIPGFLFTYDHIIYQTKMLTIDL